MITKLKTFVEKYLLKRILETAEKKDRGRFSLLKQEGEPSTPHFSAKKADTTREFCLPLDTSLRQNEIDAFRLKTIVLLKEGNMIGTPICNLLKDPIQVTVVEQDKQIIQLTQEFEWSGTIYQIIGKFVRDPNKKNSIPLRDSFKITPQSNIQK